MVTVPGKKGVKEKSLAYHLDIRTHAVKTKR